MVHVGIYKEFAYSYFRAKVYTADLHGRFGISIVPISFGT